MTWTEEKVNQIIWEDKDSVSYQCECGNENNLSFDYKLRDKRVIHHGQCVEGDREELITFETTLPDQTQCSDCNKAYDIEVPSNLFGRYQSDNFYGNVAIHPQEFGSRTNIPRRLEEAIKAISVTLSEEI